MNSNYLHDFFFFFNDTATTEIYTLSLHDALPICTRRDSSPAACRPPRPPHRGRPPGTPGRWRSEEHTSELQSQSNLVCRLLLEKKKKNMTIGVRAPQNHMNFIPIVLVLATRHWRS